MTGRPPFKIYPIVYIFGHEYNPNYILPLLKTEVIGSQLIISEPANAQISDRDVIRFTITVKKLVDVSIRNKS